MNAPETKRPRSSSGGIRCREDDEARLAAIERCVRGKMAESTRADFIGDEQRMLGVFFDLAQEYADRRDLLTLGVLLPLLFFGLDMRIYLRTAANAWRLERCLRPPKRLPEETPPDVPAVRGDAFYAPIPGFRDTAEFLGYSPPGDILGWIEISDGANLSEHRRAFFKKYAARIGFQLHNRLVLAKNEEHLRFIQNLVADIGHNVIAPNMTLKLFFNHLGRTLRQLEETTAAAPQDVPAEFLEDLDELAATLRTQFTEITRHYEQTSLFLETLLRRSHFEKGRYVLEKRLVNLRTQIVEPQVERYSPRLADRGIAIDLSMGGIPDRPVLLMADLGLLAQVYANLFSNAVKYAEAVPGADGEPRKFMAYGMEMVPDAFGPGRAGVKLNVFTTGPNIPEAERSGLFSPGFRASTGSRERGSGQGLAFVRQVVDLHGGRAGYEPLPSGNNFFILLPLESPPRDPRG